MLAEASRSMDIPMPNSLTWPNTRKDMTMHMRAFARDMVLSAQQITATSIMAIPAACSTSS